MHQPGAVYQRTVERRRGWPSIGCGAGQRRDSARVALETGRFQVGGVAEPGEGISRWARPERAPRRRLDVHHGGPHVRGAGHREQLTRLVEEDRGDGGVEGPAGPPTDGLDRQLGAADGVEHHGGVAGRGIPGRLGYLIGGQPGRRAVPVEPFERAQHRLSYGLRQSQPLGQQRADLAVGTR